MAWLESVLVNARRRRRHLPAGTASLVATTACLVAAISGCSSAPSRSGAPTTGRPSPTAVGSSTSGATTPSTASPMTVTHQLVVWTSQSTLSPGLRVLSTQAGDCFSNAANTLVGGYRCSAGNLVYDFCFAPPTSAPTQVACMLAPWETGVHILNVTGRLPAGTMPPPVLPWAFELSNGVRCVESGGANPQVDDTYMFFTCDPSKRGLASSVDKSSPLWTTQYSPGPSGPLTTEQLITAWI